MSARTRALGVLMLILTAAMAVALPGSALAQVVDVPPPAEELGAADNWTYKMMAALAALAALLLVASLVGYVVKAREFKANEKRGGSK